jgi:hypothetical protein
LATADINVVIIEDPLPNDRITKGLFSCFRGRDVSLIELHASPDGEPMYR